MKKTIVLTAFFTLTLGVLSSYSQSKVYEKTDISTYYSPDILRQQLDLTFDLSNSFNTSNDNSIKYSNNSFNWDLKPQYNRYKNNRYVVSNLNISGSTVGNLSKTSTTNNTNRQSINSSLSAYYNIQLYSKTKFHLIFNSFASYDNEFGNSKSDLSQDVNNSDKNNNSLSLNAGLGVGYGRIENVEDARQAVYILSTLTDKNRMSHTLNEDEIFEFAKVITAVKNKRHLDSRLRKIEEISAVDSFLVNKSMKSASDATYFSSLNDMWEYGALVNRKSGQVLQLIANPGFKFNNEDIYYENSSVLTTKSEFKKLTGMVQLKYQYEKPSNLYWQHSIVADIQYIYNDNNSKIKDGSELNTWENIASVNGKYTIGYYPNTRTYYTGSILLYSSYNNYKEDWVNFENYNRIYQSTLLLNMYYYFSPQLKLSGGLTLNYYNSNDNNSYRSNFFAGAGVKLNYSFF